MPRDPKNAVSNINAVSGNNFELHIKSSTSDTSLNARSATSVTNRRDFLSDAIFRFQTPAELLTVLERNHQHSFTLTGGKGLSSFYRLLKEVHGKVLSDGTIVKANLRGRISFLPPTHLGSRGNTQADLATDLTILKRGIDRSCERSMPLNLKIDNTNVTDNYLHAYLTALVQLISAKEDLKIRFYVDEMETLNTVRNCLDGMQLQNGNFIRVDNEGHLSIQKYYRLGENGCSINELNKELSVIHNNLIKYQRVKIKTVVWIPSENFDDPLGVDIRRVLQASLTYFRKAGIANNLVLKTESNSADRLPGFVRMSSHATVIEESSSSLLTEDAEKVAIVRIKDLLSKKFQSKPLVVWIKRLDIGPELMSYLVELKHRYQDDLKIIGTNELLEKIDKVLQRISDDSNIKKPSNWSIRNLFAHMFFKLSASPT